MNTLKWKGHQSNIYEIQKNLRNDSQSCEVTLVGKGKSVRAHRFVLSSCSDMLRGILAEIPIEQEATIIVPDIKGTLLEYVLAFIYMGETCLSSNDYSEFMEAINNLGIKSSISYVCNTGTLTSEIGNGNSGDSLPSKGISNSMQIIQDEIIKEEPIASPKMEEETVYELEFLDVSNEPQPKITYTIEHIDTATTNEIILTKNSGAFTLTQNSKLVGPNMAEKINVEPPKDDADDSCILEEISDTTESIIEMSTVNNSAAIASTSGNVVSFTKPTLIHIKPKSKIKQRNLSHHQQQQKQLAMNKDSVVDTSATSSMAHDVLNTSADSLSSSSALNDNQLFDEKLEMAVQSVLNEGMTLQKAAQKYHISKTVLWRRAHKHPMYTKNSRENPLLEAARNRIRSGQSLKVISQALDIPMSTLHRQKKRLAQQGPLPYYMSYKKRRYFSKKQLKEKLSKAVQACLHDGMSQHHAAKLYEIPKSTLCRHLQKAKLPCLEADESIKGENIFS